MMDDEFDFIEVFLRSKNIHMLSEYRFGDTYMQINSKLMKSNKKELDLWHAKTSIYNRRLQIFIGDFPVLIGKPWIWIQAYRQWSMSTLSRW